MSDHEHEDKPMAKDAKSDAKPRMSTIPTELDVGPQIIGSYHLFNVASVVNTSSLQGSSVVIETEPLESQFFPESRKPISIDQVQILRVGFAPKERQQYAGLLRVVATHGDNSTEEKEVRLRGSGRQVGELRSSENKKQEAGKAHEIAPGDRSKVDQVPLRLMNDLNHAANKAKIAAGSIATQQDLGVRNAWANEKKFAKEVPEPPWWVLLAELAVQMGISAIAATMSKVIGKAIGPAPKIDPTGQKPPSDSLVTIGVTDAVKDGLKTSGKGLVATITSKEKPKDKPNHGEFSDDRENEFFAQQHSMLATDKERNEHMIEDTRYALEPHLATNPTQVLQEMQDVTTKLTEASKQAIQTQQAATEQQWIVGVARAKAGRTNTKSPDGKNVEVTNLEYARRGTIKDGVLFVRVDTLDTALDFASSYKVFHTAEMEGVSQVIANRLLDTKLDELGIPIVFDLHGAVEALISRDEAGGIRFKGKTDKWRDERQHLRLAEKLVDALSQNKLRGVGVQRIKTDDANR